MGVELSKNYVVRINLKTGYSGHPVDREKLIKHCLENKEYQYVVIGWSDRYNNGKDFDSYQKFHEYVKDTKGKSRFNAAFGIFWDTTKNDLFWTRDTSGIYWICRAKGPAEAGREFYSEELDIGAVVPVEAYAFGTQVPGQIKASFNRPNGGKVKYITILLHRCHYSMTPFLFTQKLDLLLKLPLWYVSVARCFFTSFEIVLGSLHR